MQQCAKNDSDMPGHARLAMNSVVNVLEGYVVEVDGLVTYIFDNDIVFFSSFRCLRFCSRRFVSSTAITAPGTAKESYVLGNYFYLAALLAVLFPTSGL
jgi:hypothetical protein